ncbi:hypothetical protein SRABI123_05692 [Pseudomonas sp. Bi123]|nr:hypothetical protein SRABI123_05692 [Pseudomonas sp. Bi123]
MPRNEIALLIATRLIHRRRLVQRIAPQHHQHRRNAIADALAEIAGLERRRDHLIDDHRTLRIGQAIFQAITDFDPQFSLGTRDNQQRAVVLVLLANAPVASQLITEVRDVGALQVRQRDHHQLLAGGFLVGIKLLNQLLAHRWLDHLGVVHHPSGQFRKLQPGLGRQGKDPEQQHQAHFHHAHWQPLPWWHFKPGPAPTGTSLQALSQLRGWWPRKFRGSASRCTTRCATSDRGRCEARYCISAPRG